ncbi:DUF2256 and DUF3253 domain-containing protein [Herbiconiux sp. L3-i23]|uniref:DUF2256 and DUF3253 domain-containing protein n=1 Tax=Herbiconiux sp. L3-i23 TaxID=2905871 RepID=UPI002062F24C|nr:DUF2256 and DUF3253 domain-containing protein [Herbiconiux sp. L3-i23]BDI22506.1 hypothetical protein L3i23_12820 [Herbiconiux sp. L3-i23]
MSHRRTAVPAARKEKTCAVCGRRIEWRKKWERSFDEVKYCSDSCRRSKLTEADERYERRILELLSTRAESATICPSEVARSESADEWRDLMEPVRRAARRLVAQGEVEITQRGSVVDPSTAKGPIRIRRARRP